MKQKSQSVPLREDIAPKCTRTQFLPEEITIWSLSYNEQMETADKNSHLFNPERKLLHVCMATPSHALPLWLL